MCRHLRAASVKPKSLQTSVSKRGARTESFLVSLLVLESFHRCSQKLLKTLSFTLSNNRTVLSQFEAPIQRKGNCGARGAERKRGRAGKGEEKGKEKGVAKHSARVVPDLVPE